MTIRRGNNIIASSGGNGLQMFDFKWSDHTINDLNWILSAPNSWHSGTTYKKMYNHLITDYTNGVQESETIGSYTITYMLAPDGHKIVNTSGEETVANIYNSTGIGWYYIIDTTTQQFKLPRTKFAFESGATTEIGEYVEPGLPNITGQFNNSDVLSSPWANGAFYLEGSGQSKEGGGASGDRQYLAFDASRSNSIYGNSTTVQPPATKMLLYFYTAEFAVNSSSGGGGGTIAVVYDQANKRLIFESGE